MKDILFLLFLQIIISCNSSNNINDIDIYILIDNKTAGDNTKVSYILRVNKQGDLYVMKCYQSLLRIDVEKQKLYALAKGEEEKNVLVVANLDRNHTAN